MAIGIGGEPKINTHVDGETGYETVLVVYVCSQRTYAVGREYVVLEIQLNDEL